MFADFVVQKALHSRIRSLMVAASSKCEGSQIISTCENEKKISCVNIATIKILSYYLVQ